MTVDDRMDSPRYLCSHLVKFRQASKESIVNLEEIWETGAILESEEAVEPGSRAEIRSGAAFFAGDITAVERHPLGWRFEIAFSPLTRWQPENFRPEHLTEVEP